MIQILEDVESIRRRPGMYLGSTGEQGTEQFVYELVGNVLDVYLLHQATFVNIELNGTTISVSDDGPGLPFDEPSEQEGINLATYLLTHVHFGPSSNDHVPHTHMITSLGTGIAPLNALSEMLKVKSWRKGLLWEQRFSRGFAQNTATIIGKGDGRGTTIEVIPDPELFGDAKPRLGILRRESFETAHLFGGLKIGLQEERFYAPQGLRMLGLMMLVPMYPTYMDKIPEPFHITVRHENVFIEAAAFDHKESKRRRFSWVNGARTPKHGSHMEGFYQALKEVGWRSKLSLIHVITHDLQFAGPCKNQLNVPHIQEVVKNALQEPLRHHLEMTQ